MLTRFVERFCNAKLDRTAVKSLEFAMVVMMVFVAALGAVGTAKAPAPHMVAQAASMIQLASSN